MYLEHFGLAEPPFRITPHTDFFFAGANRGATLGALIYAITHDEGIVKVAGEVGSGKTMLCRVLMERLPAQVEVVYLANPSLSRDEILYAIADELGLAIADNARTKVVLRALQEHLVTLYGEGRQVVILIDEAHAMPTETLEEIRLLSNLESNRHKLLQLVLFGQPELNDVLARADMRQLKERITHNFALEPLIRDDIAQYLDFRMRAAGYHGPPVFSPAAVRLIAGKSQGLTRRINILADKALLAAFAADSHQITPKEVKAAIRDSDFSTAVGKPSRRPWILALALVLASIPVLVFLGGGWHGMTTAPGSRAIETVGPATTPAEAGTTADSVATSSVAVSGEPPGPAAPLEQDWPELGPATRRVAARSLDWLTQANDERWFLQFIRTDISEAGRVEAIVLKASSVLDPSQVRVYAVEREGSRRIGVIYGDYENRARAAAAAAQLPGNLKALIPYPRQIKRLR